MEESTRYIPGPTLAHPIPIGATIVGIKFVVTRD